MLAPILTFVALLFQRFVTGQEVSQVHLAQGKDSSSMAVMWASTASAPNSDVFYSTSPQLSGGATTHVTGVKTSYDFNYPGKANYSSPLLHSAVLTGLSPRTQYFYKVGDSASSKFSAVFNFTTMPARGDTVPFSLGVIGDLGGTADSIATMEHLIANPHLELILLAGDLSYADCTATKWDDWGNMVQPLTSARALHVGPGNHEIEYIAGDTGTELFLAFQSRYVMPGDKPAQRGEIVWMDPSYQGCCPSAFISQYDYGSSYYSFDLGMAHVVFLNPYSPTSKDSLQFAWLLKDLSTVDRAVTPWIVVVTHCPMYNSNKAHHDEHQTVLMLANMETLFYDHGVNIIFAGHVHAYERSHPTYQNVTNARGSVYINIGDGGNAEGHSSSYYAPAPAWSAFRNGTQYGHGEIKFINSTTSVWTWYRNIDGEYVSKDEYTLTNTATITPPPAPSSATGADKAPLSPGDIAGIAAGVFVAILLFLIFYFRAALSKSLYRGRLGLQLLPEDEKEGAYAPAITVMEPVV